MMAAVYKVTVHVANPVRNHEFDIRKVCVYIIDGALRRCGGKLGVRWPEWKELVVFSEGKNPLEHGTNLDAFGYVSVNSDRDLRSGIMQMLRRVAGTFKVSKYHFDDGVGRFVMSVERVQNVTSLEGLKEHNESSFRWYNTEYSTIY